MTIEKRKKIIQRAFLLIYSASILLCSSCGRLLDEVLNLDPRDDSNSNGGIDDSNNNGGIDDSNNNEKTGIWVVISDDSSSDLSIFVDEKDGYFVFSATEGFSSYSWKLDGVDLTSQTSSASETMSLANISQGYHTISVEAIDYNGRTHFASCSMRKLQSTTDKTTSIIISNDLNSSNQLFISVDENNGRPTFYATEGFASYSWKLDGVDLTSQNSSASETMPLSNISQGYHIVSVEAIDYDGRTHFASCTMRKIRLPTDKAINIEIVNDSISKNPLLITQSIENDSVEFSATENFSSYKWYIDGSATTSENKKTTIQLANISAGYHTISVEAVNSDGIKQFATVIFRKEQK